MSSMIKPVLGSQLELGHLLARGLIGLWLMNEGSGNIIQGLSGNGKVGTLSGPVWQGGKNGIALNFNGSNDYGSIPIDLSGTEIITLAFGLNWPAAGSDWDVALEYTSNYNNGNGFYFSPDGDGGGFYIGIRTDVYTTAEFANPSTGYHNYAIVLDITTGPDEIVAYVDGVSQTLVYGNQNTSGTGFANDILYLMSRAGSSLFGQGKLEYLYIYNRRLASSQVAQLHREPFAIFEREPIELWVGSVGTAPPVGNAGIMTPNTGFWGPTF